MLEMSDFFLRLEFPYCSPSPPFDARASTRFWSAPVLRYAQEGKSAPAPAFAKAAAGQASAAGGFPGL